MNYRIPTLSDTYRDLVPELSATKALREAAEAHFNRLSMIQPNTLMEMQQSEIERLTASLSDTAGSTLAEQMFRKIEEERRHYLDMLKPLEKFRMELADFDLPYSVKYAREFLANENSLSQITRQAAEAETLYATIRGATATSISRLSTSISAMQSEKLAELARPFSNIKNLWEFANPFAPDLRNIGGIQEALKTLHLPLIDSASAAAIGQFWGEEGIERQLRALGISSEMFLPDSQDTVADVAGTQRHQETSRFLHPDPWALLSIILTIMIFFYQKADSEQTEYRLTGEIRAVGKVQERQFEALTALLETLIEQKTGAAETRFVVRERWASIRTEPESGSSVIATAFPNQVVRLIEERGKWINIEYYDFILQQEHSGWALKKYFIRVRDSGDKR